jgi:DNA transposition AAA+ family ATPase
MNKKTMDAEQIAVIDELEKLKLDLPTATEAEFHQRYLSPYMSYTVWHRLRAHNYNGDVEKQITSVKKAIESIRDMLALRSSPDIEQNDEFHSFPVFSALFNAVSKARNRNDETRLVVYLAQTGCGKSAFIRQIMDKYNAVFCEADRSWSKSYASPAFDICHALGLPGPWRSGRSARAALIAEMHKSHGFLCIDEANTFGREACDLIKVILNQTTWTVVVTAIPIFWERMMLSSWDEAKQLLRRAVAVVRHDGIDPNAVQQFMALSGVKINISAAQDIAGAANTFGGYSMIKDIRSELLSDFKSGEQIPGEAVRHTARACLNLKGFHSLEAINHRKGRAA